MAQAVDRVFKPQVEGQTDGAVTVEVYHSGVADQQRIITAIQPTLNKLYAENAWARTLTDKVKAVH
jgi:hypothetical protein